MTMPKAAQHLTAEQTAGLVQSGMGLDYGFGVCQPDAFDRALAARVQALRGVKVRSCITLRRAPRLRTPRRPPEAPRTP